MMQLDQGFLSQAPLQVRTQTVLELAARTVTLKNDDGKIAYHFVEAR